MATTAAAALGATPESARVWSHRSAQVRRRFAGWIPHLSYTGAPLRLHSRACARLDDQEVSSRLSFIERLGKAWDILFPSEHEHGHPHQQHPISNAEIAKQRLKMILISDRCSINDDARKKIVDNIVGALADFVEIESEDKVQLNVLVDPDLGTVYSVTVPVRRVKPEYQDYSNELENVDLGSAFAGTDGGSGVRTVGIRLEYGPGMEPSP